MEFEENPRTCKHDLNWCVKQEKRLDDTLITSTRIPLGA